MSGRGSLAAALTGLDGALSRHSAWLILAVLALAFALRVTAAGGPFLHGDELRIYQIAAHPDLASVYRLSAKTAHPPLFFEALHFWIRGAQSEVYLRLLSVLAGTAAVGVLYLWIRNQFGGPAALCGAAIAAMTPLLIDLSGQIRGYAFLHVFIISAFFFQDRFFRSRRWPDLAGAALAMTAAILTEHSAIFAAVALGALALIGIARGRLSRREVVLYAAFQILFLAVAGSVNARQILDLRGGRMESRAQTTWLSASYHDPSREGGARFVLDRTARIVVEYSGAGFARPLIRRGRAAIQLGFLLLAVGALLVLARRRIRSAAFLDATAAAVVAFSLTAAAGLARLYPYGPTRHDSFLILFLLPLMGFACSELARDRQTVAVAIAACLIAYLWHANAFRQAVFPPAHNRIEAMRAATRAVRQEIPPGARIFTDQVGAMQLGYYLARSAVPRIGAGGSVDLDGFVVFPAGGAYTFGGQPAIFSRSAEQARAVAHLEPPYWVFIGGSPRLSPQLDGVSRVHEFGPRIEFFEYTGPPLAGPGSRPPVG